MENFENVRAVYVKRFLMIFALEILVEIVGYQGMGHLVFGRMWDSGMQNDIIIHIGWMFVISTPVLFGCVTHSVRKERTYVRALRNTETGLQSLFTHSSSGIVAFDNNGYITNCNPVFHNMTGYSTAEVLGRRRYEFVPETQVDLARSGFHQALGGKSFEFENQLIHKDGHLIAIESVNVPIYKDDEITGVYAILKDITERKRYEREMWELAHYDHLTNLPNRRLFLQTLLKTIEASQVQNQRVGVLFLDLDRFKDVNDSLGHDIGDQLLIQMGRRMHECLPTDNLLARLGGDEFAVLLPNIGHVSKAEKVAQCLIEEVQKPVFIDGYELYLTSSIGVALYPVFVKRKVDHLA